MESQPSSEEFTRRKPEKQPVRQKKRKRKHKVKSNVKTDDLILFMNNINGYDSKSVSFAHIVNTVLPSIDLSPDIIGIVETKSRYNRQINVPGFASIQRNRKDKEGGGIVTLVKNKDAPSVIKVCEGSGKDEFLVFQST